MKKLVCGAIFGLEYMILATKKRLLGKMEYCGWYERPFWGSKGAPDGRGWQIRLSQRGMR